MAIKTQVVVVNNTPTRLDVAPDADLQTGQSISIVPTADIFIGGPDVAASGVTKGRLVEADEEFSLDLKGSDKLYGIAASGSVDVSVLQSGV